MHLENCKGDISQQWKIINKLTGSSKDNCIDRIELDNGTVITEPCDIAQEINNHLISVQSGQPSTVPAITLPPIRAHQNSFFIAPTSVEVKTVVFNLKIKNLLVSLGGQPYLSSPRPGFHRLPSREYAHNLDSHVATGAPTPLPTEHFLTKDRSGWLLNQYMTRLGRDKLTSALTDTR
ncbi:hypothetical protein J6590_081176 [Homalodisca vitripennis]|nr:hypothetical protein J6590_081176 [Homalodisca vitripennis]